MVEFFEQIGNFFNDIFTNLLNFFFDFSFNTSNIFFGWLNLPSMPTELKNSLDSYLDLIFDNAGFIFFFIRRQTFNVILVLLPVLWTSKLWFRLLKWVIRHTPFSILFGK